MIFFCALPNEVTDEIVEDKEHEDFLFDHDRRLATEHFHAQRGFDVSESQFDHPALEEQLSQSIGGISRWVQQGRDQGDALGAEATLGDAEAQDAHLQSVGQGVEFFEGHVFCALEGFEPEKEGIIFAKTFSLAKVDRAYG